MSKAIVSQTPRWEGMRAAVYLRVSSEEQLQGYSLEAQENQCRRYVAGAGMQVVQIFREEGQSAFRGQRPEFAKLIAAAERGEFDAVIVHKWDRFGRNREEVIVNKFLLRKKCGLKVLSVMEAGEDDGNGITGVLLEGIMESVNHWYSVNLGAEISKSYQEKHEQGYHLKNPPFGYDLHERNLTINEIEAKGIQKAFEVYVVGESSYTDIADLLNELGFKTKTGRLFSKDNIREMLRNPIYIGKVRYQRASYNPDGSRSFKNEVSIRNGLHPAIISPDLFERVQHTMEQRKQKKGKKSSRPYLLKGLLFCERCMDNVPKNPLPSWGKMYCREHSIHHTRYAYCYSRNRGTGSCGQPSNKVDIFEQQVLQVLFHLKPGRDWRKRAIDAVASKIGATEIQKRFEELKIIARNMDFRFDNGLIVNLEEYRAERVKIQGQIDQLTPLMTLPEELEKAADLLSNFQTHFEACGNDIAKQHEVVKLVVERVYVRDEQVTRIMLTEKCEIAISGTAIFYSDNGHIIGRRGT